MKKTNDRQMLIIRVDEDKKEKLERLAREYDRTVAAFVRLLIDQAIIALDTNEVSNGQ